MDISRVLSKMLVSAALLTFGTATAFGQDGTVLALGDSVVFGYITQDGYAYVNAANFVGYPNYVGSALNFDVVNASCPGETSGSFLSSTAPDNGCRAFRSQAPLHVAYTSTQMAFATSYLTAHLGSVHLVTIGIGANDGFLLEASCASNPNPPLCIEQGVPALLHTVATNVAAILAGLRATGYGGTIEVVNYYSTDYSNASATQLTRLLNDALSGPAVAYGAVVANAFTAFNVIAANPLVGGMTCHAGLLNVDPQDQTMCDVHPSQTGQQVIAGTVVRAYKRAQN
jgi:lysophospholipase L1-like esterase